MAGIRHQAAAGFVPADLPDENNDWQNTEE
jgi:hypothetical protein